MKTAIYGAGAMGTILGAYLGRAGVDIVLVNRNKAHVEELNSNGSKVVGEVEFTQRVKAILPEEMEEDYDVVFLMTKQSENEMIARFLKSKIKDEGVLCTTQNGLPEIKLIEILGEEKVVGCTAVWGATLESPGVARLTSKESGMSFQIGCLFGGNERQIQKVKSLLEYMCPVYIEQNFLGARWSKLLINAAFSGLSVILGLTFGEVAKNRKSREIAQRVIKEAIDTAKAADIRIAPLQGKDIVKLMDYNGKVKKFISRMIIPVAIKKHKSIVSGMLIDLQRGRKTEVDKINGIICNFGKKYHFKTPFNDRIVNIVHQIENGEIEVSIENVYLFDDLLKG